MRGARLREFSLEQDSILPIMELVSSEHTDDRVNQGINRQSQSLSATKEKHKVLIRETRRGGQEGLEAVLSETSLNPEGKDRS